MKVLVALCVLALVALSSCSPTGHSRGCQYILGKCYKSCEEGTHSYSVGCAPVTPEATCDEPNPVASKAAICDYSSCHCDAPTVRDSVSRKCVKLEDCPKKENPEKENPKIENPKIENPKIENPKIENPKIENPKIENPKTENPKIENPKPENPKIENPKKENPKIENPKKE